MGALTVRAHTRAGVAANLLAEECTVWAGLDSPAMSFSGRFSTDNFAGEISDIEVFLNGKIWFRGRTDKQEIVLSARGRHVALEARTRGALLLDNEAEPRQYHNVGWDTMFRRHGAPYSFLSGDYDKSKTLLNYQIPKGTSEWEALTGWVYRAYGWLPCVQENSILLRRPIPAAVPVFSNKGGGLPYTTLIRRFIPYHIISQTILRDSAGGYSTPVRNKTADDYAIQRKRYEIPQTEFTAFAVWDAEQRMAQAAARSRTVTLEAPLAVAEQPQYMQTVQKPLAEDKKY